MHMKVRNALADLVVDRHKSSLRGHAFLHSPAKNLCAAEKRPRKSAGQVHQCLVVCPGDQQAMTGKERAVVQEGHAGFIIQHK
jgi:hypothetical protein